MSTFQIQCEDCSSAIATEAADQAYTSYHDMREFTHLATQVDFTAGSGGGTISVKAYGSLHPFATAGLAEIGDSGDAFPEITTAALGAEITADGLVVAKDITGVQWLKIVATIANKDAATAFRVRIAKVRK